MDMSTTQLTCPICDAVMRLTAAPTPGARTRCPRCGTPFSLDAPASSAPPAVETRPAPFIDAGQAIREAPVGKSVTVKNKFAAPRIQAPDDGDKKNGGIPL